MNRQKRRILKLALIGWGIVTFLILLSADAKAVSINWGAAGNPIYDEGGIGHQPLAAGDVVQLIWDRAGDGIDPPGIDGMPTDDDELIHISYIGRGSFFDGEFSDNILTGAVGVGDILYVRAWNDTLLRTAARYGDTGQHSPQVWIIDSDVDFTLNATENGSWATVLYKLKLRSRKLEPLVFEVTAGVADVSHWGDGMAILYDSRPNPFRNSTMIGFCVAGDGPNSRVTVKIYDVRGSLIRNLFSEEEFRAERWLAWDGKNDLGMDAGSGTYICRMEILDNAYRTRLSAKLILTR